MIQQRPYNNESMTDWLWYNCNVTVFFRWVCVAMVQTASVGKDCLNCFNNGSFV